MSARLKRKIPKLSFPIALLAGTFSTLCFYHVSHGPVSSPDTGTFSEWADLLISVNFNFFSYYSSNDFVVPSYLYTIPVTLVAALKITFGEAWKISFLIVNLASLLGILAFGYKTLRLLLIPPIISSLAFVTLFVSDAYLVWPRYVLTDTIFSASVVAAFFLLISIFKSGSSGRHLFSSLDFGVIAILGVMTFTRPTAAPYIAAIGGCWALTFFALERAFFTAKHVLVASAVILFVSGLLSSTLYWAQLFTSLEIRALNFLGAKYSEGMVVLARPETWAAPPTNWLEIFKIYWLKVFYFWAPWAEGFSLIHKLLNALFWFFCAGALVGWGIYKPQLHPIQRDYLKLLVISLACVTAFQAATMVDFDWRYRYPLVIPILIGASCLYWQIVTQLTHVKRTKINE